MGSLRTLGSFALMALPLPWWGCSSFDGKFTECNLGTVSGAWQVHYTETSGNCGPISDDTLIYTGGVSAIAAECSLTTTTSLDGQCRMLGSSECRTKDDLAMQEWTWALTQTSVDQAKGNGKVRADHTTLGNCQSTYEITIRRL